MRARSIAVASTLALASGLARRHRRIAGVAPELRHPLLYLPMSLRNDFTLKIVRRLPLPAESAAKGVETRTEIVPAAGNQPEVRMLVHEPEHRTEPSGALLWIHGGGLVMGSADNATATCTRLAAELGIVVVNVDYRLAPEHPFPAGLDDCFAALTWTASHADDLRVDATRIAVGGDSAGGGLAACLAQLAHDRGGPPIYFQLLIYPMLDDRTALRTGHDALFWNQTSNNYAWSAYLGRTAASEEARPYAAAARRDDLRGLPAAWIGVGDIDLFHDEATNYAHRLQVAGVPCEITVVAGMYHGADVGRPHAPAMKEFRAGMLAALRKATSPRIDTQLED